MSEQNEPQSQITHKQRRIELTGTQVVASVLATVTGTVAASYLGIAGTLIGAAVMSVASTAGSAVYKFYLTRTASRLRDAAPTISHRAVEHRTVAGTRTTLAEPPGTGPVPVTRDGDALTEIGSAGESTAAFPEAAPPSLNGSAPPPDRPIGPFHRAWAWLQSRPLWAMVTVASACLFVLVIAGVSVFELADGKPLDAAVWHRHQGGTTVGGLIGGHSAKPAKTTPASPSPSPSGSGGTSPSPSVSPSASPSGSGSASPSGSPTPTGGSPSPTSSGSASPSPSSSASPQPSASASRR